MLCEVRIHRRPPPVIVEGEREWEVDRIQEHREANNRLEYLVPWKDYPSGDATWLPAS
ncbi:hypothetical protein BGZ52_001385, partial [Haplosporangium bisporale]